VISNGYSSVNEFVYVCCDVYLPNRHYLYSDFACVANNLASRAHVLVYDPMMSGNVIGISNNFLSMSDVFDLNLLLLECS
jgi:hypothetical protein